MAADDADHGEPIELSLDDKTVTVTKPDKVFFSGGPFTKLDLIEYYRAVEGPLLRAVGDRPTMMQRFPNGASGKSFFQKRVPESHPDWLQTTVVATVNGTESDALVLADMAHVAWAVNQGVLGFHPWPFRVTPGEAGPFDVDEMRIDLDPQPGTTFAMVREAAAEVKAYLDELGMALYPKTTGSKGMHLHVPLIGGYTSYDVRAAAITIARQVAARRPDLITDAWWKEERGERIFVDFNQNAPHKTVFGAWSARARVGAQVSTPFWWDELDTIDPDAVTIATVPARVADRGDPWATMAEHRCDISGLIADWQAVIDAGGFDAPWPPVYPKMPHEPPRVAPSRARRDPDQDGD